MTPTRTVLALGTLAAAGFATYLLFQLEGLLMALLILVGGVTLYLTPRDRFPGETTTVVDHTSDPTLPGTGTS